MIYFKLIVPIKLVTLSEIKQLLLKILIIERSLDFEEIPVINFHEWFVIFKLLNIVQRVLVWRKNTIRKERKEVSLWDSFRRERDWLQKQSQIVRSANILGYVRTSRNIVYVQRGVT